jgi:hypothetical protein
MIPDRPDLPGEGRYLVRRIQEVEVDTRDWGTLNGQTEWTDSDIIGVVEFNYDFTDDMTTYEVVSYLGAS